MGSGVGRAIAVLFLLLGIALLVAAVPSVMILLVRPRRTRQSLYAAGFSEGTLIELAGDELIVQHVGWRTARLSSEDGSTTIVSNEVLLAAGRVIAACGEPVPVSIRFVLPAATNLELARVIAMRTIASSPRLYRAAPVRCETVAIAPDEVEFVIHACARDANSRSELLSELKGGIYRWWKTAGIRPIRVS